jgi:hypothetical protein
VSESGKAPEGHATLRAIVVMQYTDENGRVMCGVADCAEVGLPIGLPAGHPDEADGVQNLAEAVYRAAGHQAFRHLLLLLGRVDARAMSGAERRVYAAANSADVATCTAAAAQALQHAERTCSSPVDARIAAWKRAAEAQTALAGLLPDDDAEGQAARCASVVALMRAGELDAAEEVFKGYLRAAALGPEVCAVSDLLTACRATWAAVWRVYRERFSGKPYNGGEPRDITVTLRDPKNAAGNVECCIYVGPTAVAAVAPVLTDELSARLRVEGFRVAGNGHCCLAVEVPSFLVRS